MRILEGIDQGSEEWNRIRGQHNTASEAPVVVGASSKVKRNELVHIKATGDEKQVSDWVQVNLFDKGHEVEALGRPIAEEIVGEELYPATAVDDDDYLLASFDGITMLEDQGAEIKQWNEAKAAEVREGRVPDEDYWQVVQQLMVSGARRWLYLVTDGTRENSVHCWVELDQKDADRLMASWRQFEEDVKNYTPDDTPPEATAEPVTDLPAVSVQVTGSIDVADNFKVFEDAPRDFLDNHLIREPETDQDFADLGEQIKSLEKAEAALDGAETYMLSQVEAIDAAKRQKDMLRELVRQNRIAAQKLVESEKKRRRGEILQKGKDALAAHIGQLNQTLGSDKVHMPEVSADFAGAMKGKRTIASLRDAADTELARAKIEASQIADKIRLNLQTLREDAKGYEGLFADAQQLVMKETDDLKNLIKLRITEHKQAEKEREEAIRAEERAKAERAAARKAAESAPVEAPQASQSIPAGEPVGRDRPAAPARPDAGQSRGPAPSRPMATEGRPSDDAIIEVLALHYRVHESKIIEWLLSMDLEAASNRMAEEFA